MQSEETPLEVGDLLLIGEDVLGAPASELLRVVDVSKAASALAAPYASFGGEDFYPDPVQRAAILCSRLVRNHPLPDGNKRLAFAAMRFMLDRDGFDFEHSDGGQEGTAEVIRALAAREITEEDFVAWVRVRVGRSP